MSQADQSLVSLIRTIVNASIAEALAKTRTPAVLSGAVEDLDDDLDVAWVRNDQAAMGGDPAQSDNWGAPGVIPATRLGETFTGEQVRVGFDGAAGASAMRTSAAKQIILPFGKESAPRINLDGEIGLISAGDDITPAARVTIDPVGGIRIFHDSGILSTVLGHEAGLQLRHPTSGVVTADLNAFSGLRLVDQTGTDDIELVTSSSGTLPNPAYRSAAELNPGTTIVAPLAPTFTFTPADDVSIAHAAAWVRSVKQTGTWTPPGPWTERTDDTVSPDDSTLSTSVATRDPATGAAGTFTSSRSNWQHGIGTHVVIRGGGTTSPSYRSESHGSFSTSATTALLSLAKPTGTAANDVLVAFVAMGNDGGSVPTGWTTPEGWVFLGAIFGISGTAPAQSMLAVGVWAKLATASEPATYDVTITMGVGRKTFHATIVAIQNPFLISGGAHIRIAGHPIRRLLAFNEITAADVVLCDFQNIPGGYDHLELVYAVFSDRATDALRNIRMQFNGDTTQNNYRWQTSRDGTITGGVAGVSQDRIIAGAVDGGALNSESGGCIQILDYVGPHRRFAMGNEFFITAGGDLVDESMRCLWLNTANPVNRVRLAIDTGTTLFNVGSRVFLYGY